MSLDVYLYETRPTEVYSSNVTHNLIRMAEEAGIYNHLWCPDEIGITKAAQLIEPLKAGLALMESEPDRFRPFSAGNGWGTYDQFLPWVRKYLDACIESPDAAVMVSR